MHQMISIYTLYIYCIVVVLNALRDMIETLQIRTQVVQMIVSHFLKLMILNSTLRCVKAVMDPYDSIDKEAWTDNLEKGGLQSFM